MLVAMTGCGQQDDRLRTQEAGFDRHLVKPVGARRLAIDPRRCGACPPRRQRGESACAAPAASSLSSFCVYIAASAADTAASTSPSTSR
jgi:CheY-like chemotaxis protein